MGGRPLPQVRRRQAAAVAAVLERRGLEGVHWEQVAELEHSAGAICYGELAG